MVALEKAGQAPGKCADHRERGEGSSTVPTRPARVLTCESHEKASSLRRQGGRGRSACGESAMCSSTVRGALVGLTTTLTEEAQLANEVLIWP